MQILEIAAYDEKVRGAVNRLLPQLSAAAVALSADDLVQMVRSDAIHLLMAESEGRYIGTLTLVVLRTPTGCRARIEDVVVDAKARAGGVGRKLCEHALALAADLNVKSVELTSHPSRAAANALYRKLGFEQRETNSYRYVVSAPPST